jgi:hypothetical protein
MSIAQAQARFARVPFAIWLGMTLVDATPGRAVLALPFQPVHANASGPLNGGASASLLLMAGTVAAWTDIDLDTEPHLSWVDSPFTTWHLPGKKTSWRKRRWYSVDASSFFSSWPSAPLLTSPSVKG